MQTMTTLSTECLSLRTILGFDVSSFNQIWKYIANSKLHLIFFFFFLMNRRPPKSPLFPYPTLFRSQRLPLIAIISYEYFQRQFGSNPAVLGQSLNKGKPFSPRIVGVLAPHFQIYFPPSADLEAEIGRAHV